MVAKEKPSPRLLRFLEIAVALLVIARCAWIFSTLLRSPGLPLGLAQDDFYYYLRPAQNFAWYHRSTFFRNTLTNGFHPLYFLLLTGVSFFVRTLPGIFRVLWVLDTLSASAVFFLSRRIFSRVSAPILANGLAVLTTALCITQICSQMEVMLALPLGFAFLLTGFVPGRQLTSRRMALLGLLAALTFLARLDAVLLVVFYVVGATVTPEYRTAFRPKNLGSFLATSLPLPAVYLWANYHYFHTIMPVSGMAKELRRGWVPSILLPMSFAGTNQMLMTAAIVTMVLAWALRAHLAPRERVFLIATLLSPLSFYGLEMFVSDWMLWPWYFYAMRFAGAGIGVFLATVISRNLIPVRYPRLRSLAQSNLLAGSLCLVALLKLFRANYNLDQWMLEIEHAAHVLDDFAALHPGVYAMGDRAGMFAITTPSPVLQAEGLVMDRAYVEHIRAQDDLRSVLRSYGVDYYVAFVFKTNYRMQFSGSCFHAMEPSIAGPSSLRMRSDFCDPPVYTFPGFDGRYMIYRIKPSS